MKKLNTLFTVIFIGALLNAQTSEIQWAVCLGGTNTEDASTYYNTTNSVFGLRGRPTLDGGYVVAGSTGSNNGYVSGFHGGSADMWIVKTDSNGNFQWQRCVGTQSYDTAADIVQTTDGGYIAVGNTRVNGGDVTNHISGDDIWVVRMDEEGNVLWNNCFGGNSRDRAYSVEQTADGGFVVAGFAGPGVPGYHNGISGTIADMYVIKLDSGGNLEWQKAFGGSGDDFAHDIQQTSDGGYILAGGTNSKNNGDVSGNHIYYDSSEGAYLASIDYWIVKLDSTGNMQWQRCLGGTGEDTANAVRQTSDGGYIIAGRSNSNNGEVTGNHGNYDYWVVKLDNTGNLQWQKSLGGTKSDQANDIQQTADGGYIIAGGTTSADGDITNNHGSNADDYWIVKLNSQGILEWEKSLGGSSGDTAFSIENTNDGGYIVAGKSNSKNGDVTGNHAYPSDFTSDFWLVKLTSGGTAGIKDGDFLSDISIYPNPAGNIVYLSIKAKEITIHDLSGKTVKTEKGNIDNVDISLIPPGNYIIQGITQNGKKFKKKIVKE